MAFGRFVNSLFGGAPQPPAVIDTVPEATVENEDVQTERALGALRSSTRLAGRELPTLLLSRLGQIDDLLREVVSTIAAQDASTEQRVLLAAMVNDYIPTPLRAYLALPEEDRADDAQATLLFANQLGLLEETVRDLLNQIRIGAIAELSTHGRFLADKFQAPDAALTLGGSSADAAGRAPDAGLTLGGR
ncbi:hypothetical protein [Subtercola boreus]|uniref:Uncharacterized protein n=1 Tax=Subtercola boreus TaxID=120213 RepID=A0A3E0WH37_9MICO|nr:hypothetical protein [Subtercola boreus]RFA23564.1 hypothetical protein B7R24_01410 [Subtercola boreus]RFA23958.1 hypothetical protein B7R23_01410 [Subtercola boreus]RFA29656.1 hypothetical protein B7R25_01405 [Subtercola boreus]